MPYEECYRIPLVVAWPGRIKPGSACDHLVQLHDLAHTFTEIAGGQPLPYANGRSLTPLFDDPTRTDWEDAILCAFYGMDHLHVQRMLVTARSKYVINLGDRDMMFDMGAAPDEMHSIVNEPAHRAIRDQLRHQLLDLMVRHGDPSARPS